MSWPKYVLLAWIALSVLLNIAYVGKRREPTTGNSAAISTVIFGGLAWLVIIA